MIQDFFTGDEEEKCRERFIKSSAAYTVISYVLGVGDRHLDNLLMKSNGDFFHVDYGFMFGQDPTIDLNKLQVLDLKKQNKEMNKTKLTIFT